MVARRTDAGWATRSLYPVIAANRLVISAGLNPNMTESFSSGGGAFYIGDLAAGTWTSPFSGSSAFALTTPGFSDDPAHFLLSSVDDLAFGAVAGVPNLYEYDHGALSLADRVPAFPATSCNDQGGPACHGPAAGGIAGAATPGVSRPNLISADGSKIVFTEIGTGRLYLRLDGVRTVQVSASQASSPDPNGHKFATWTAASRTGSLIYFTSCERLTDDSTATSTAADSCRETTFGDSFKQTQDLYRYETGSGQLKDLTVDHADAKGAAVQGVVGASEDGSWVYFVANGDLDGAGPAAPGNCDGVHNGACNLYVSHDGGPPSYLGSLPAKFDNGLWGPSPSSADGPLGDHHASVAADGALAFVSSARLTAYDNTGDAGPSCIGFDGTGPGPCAEVYRYHPGDAAVTCVSCDPTGAPPSAPAMTAPSDPSAGAVQPLGSPIFNRTVSADGNRVFFQTSAKLVAADVNGDDGCDVGAFDDGLVVHATGVYHCSDVYEWEAKDTPGGSCHSDDQNGGCLYLLSSGTGSDSVWIVDASASGDDVFIRTTDRLVPQDKDDLYDVYDVRVDGGLAAQHQVTPPPCGSPEQCHAQGTTASPVTGAGSGAFKGPGNGPVTRPKPCSKGKVRRGGRCVSRHPHKKHKAKHRKRSQKRANSNPGGSK